METWFRVHRFARRIAACGSVGSAWDGRRSFPAKDVCREHGIASGTYYAWKAE